MRGIRIPTAAFAAALLLFMLAAISASAQNESITVTGKAEQQSREEIIRGFVRSYVAPSKQLGKIARWQDPICPVSLGLTPEQDTAVSDRIAAVAKAVGAPMPKNMPCRNNVIVIFTTEAQPILDELAEHYRKYHQLLGDVDGPSNARHLAQMKFPVQAWYGTLIKDASGQRVPPNCRCTIYDAPTDTPLHNSITSLFVSVLVVVDVTKVKAFAVSSMADYAAMLALSQTKTFDTCRQLPTVTNLLATDCPTDLQAPALTDADLAYLRGVYKIDPADNLNFARSDIANEMGKSTAGR